MKWNKGGTTVERGVYFNPREWEFVQEYGENRVLPGEREALYLKVPGFTAVLAGPIGGLVFVILLPLVGIVGLLGFLFYRAWQGLATITHRRPQPVAADWGPEGGSPRTRMDVELDEIAREAARKRLEKHQ